MNDDQRQPLGEAAMDALIGQVVRVNAPDDFAARVRVALDSREGTSRSSLWLRPALAAAAVLLAVAIWWWRQPVPQHSNVPQVARVAASTFAAAAASADKPGAPGASAFAAHTASADRPHAPHAPVYVLVDHERALDALDDPPAVEQAAIDPAAIGAQTIDVQPADAIAPLTLDTDRPDPGGEGDHR